MNDPSAADAELRTLFAPLIALSHAMQHWPLDATVVQCADARLTVKQHRIAFLCGTAEDQLKAMEGGGQ